MGGTSKHAYALALILAAAISVGCGGRGSSTATSHGGDTVTRASGAVQSDTGAGDGFIVPGGDNSIQRFGREAPASERKAASEVLESYMQARASEQFVEECIYLARTAVEPLEKLAPSAPRGCVVALSALGSSASTGSDAMIGPVGSLRIGGGRAFALYHGSGGIDYVMPMVKEGGAWKVASLAPIEL
jgi:hypothetical protein